MRQEHHYCCSSSVDVPEGKTLRVTVALQRFKGKRMLMEPKTQTSARQLPLPDVLVAALRT